MRLCVVVTARASWARLQTIVEALRRQEAQGRCTVQLVWAGAAVLDEYGDVSDPSDARDERIVNVLAGTTHEGMAAETGLLLIHLAALFTRTRPDLVLVCADRHEVLAPAIAASYANIPVAHYLAGEVSGSIDHRVRDAISQLASVYFPPTQAAAARLQAMGVSGPIYVCGCASIDLAMVAAATPTPHAPIVVVQHAVTTEADAAFAQATATADAIRSLARPVLWIWPGEDAGGDHVNRAVRRLAAEGHAHLTFRRHIKALPFLSLVAGSPCLIGNSSVGLRECSYLGTPVVNIGTRQRGRERAAHAIDVPHDRVAILEAIQTQIAHGPYPSSLLYGRGDAGERIAEILCAGA